MTFQTLSPDAPAEPNQLRAPVRGKRGAAPTSAPSASPPPSIRRDWDACLSRRAAVCLCTVGPVTIATTGDPAMTLPGPRIVCAQAARLPNSAPVHARTLVNVALRSLVPSRNPCPRMHRKSANGRGPVPPPQLLLAVRFRGPLASLPTWSQLAARIHSPETRLVSRVHK